jgi:hypothetical protein
MAAARTATVPAPMPVPIPSGDVQKSSTQQSTTRPAGNTSSSSQQQQSQQSRPPTNGHHTNSTNTNASAAAAAGPSGGAAAAAAAPSVEESGIGLTRVPSEEKVKGQTKQGDAPAAAPLTSSLSSSSSSSLSSTRPPLPISDRSLYKTFILSHGVFEVESKYVMKEMIGQGAYGVVCSALDLQRGSLVAVKKIENVFDHRSLAKRTLRELQIVRALVHENILGLDRVVRPHNNAFNNVYMISDLMETDLACVIRSPQELTEEHVQFFIYQVLRGLKFIHSANVIHRSVLIIHYFILFFHSPLCHSFPLIRCGKGSFSHSFVLMRFCCL